MNKISVQKTSSKSMKQVSHNSPSPLIFKGNTNALHHKTYSDYYSISKHKVRGKRTGTGTEDDSTKSKKHSSRKNVDYYE